MQENLYSTSSITSKDGTRIGYRSIGNGPGIVFVQGSMGTIENFTQLAQELADSFTIHLAERRGRGISPKPYTDDYSVQRDVEDLEAVSNKTNSKNIFGLSSGGIITLKAALRLPTIEKVAVYEPALFVNGVPVKALQRFKKDMEHGRTADALVTSMKAAQMGPPALNIMPNWLLVAMTNILLRQEDKKSAAGSERFWHNVAPTLQYDFKVVEEMSTQWQTFGTIKKDVLLLGGSKSPEYLHKALNSLEKSLPKSKRIELKNLDHGAAWNYDKRQNPHGNPKLVADELRKFFGS